MNKKTKYFLFVALAFGAIIFVLVKAKGKQGAPNV
jgi:hypothetical protein